MLFLKKWNHLFLAGLVAVIAGESFAKSAPLSTTKLNGGGPERTRGNRLPGEEPFFLRSQSIGHLFRFDAIPMGTSIPSSGQWNLKVARAMANLWGYDEHYIIDGQVYDDTLELQGAWSDRWYYGAGFGTKQLSHPFSDQVTLEFHDLIEIGQDEHMVDHQNKTRIAIPDYGIEFTGEHHGIAWTEHVYVRLGHVLWKEGQGRVHIEGLFASELAENNLLGPGSQSLGLKLNTSWSSGPWGVLGIVTWIQHRSKEPTFWLKDQTQSLLTGLNYSLSQRWALTSQMLIHRPVFGDMGQLGRNTYEIHGGARLRLGNFGVQIVLIENMFWHYNSPDWGISVGVGYRSS